jgi:hypothetical protein
MLVHLHKYTDKSCQNVKISVTAASLSSFVRFGAFTATECSEVFLDDGGGRNSF